MTDVLGVNIVATGKETYERTLFLAESKLKYSVFHQSVLAIMAGMYVSVGVTVNSLVGGGLSEKTRTEEPGLFLFLYSTFGFPTALTLIILTGTELFTSTVCYLQFLLLERKVSFLKALRASVVPWLGNFAGTLLMMGLFQWSHTFSGRANFVVHLAEKKVQYRFDVAFAKGMVCNFFVNLAVWQANSARDLTGKFIGILLPISAFVVTNGEHSIANMFLISVGMANGAKVSVGQFLFRNLLPVTLGNLVGAGLLVAFFFVLAYGSMGKWVDEHVKKAEEVSLKALGRQSHTIEVRAAVA